MSVPLPTPLGPEITSGRRTGCSWNGVEEGDCISESVPLSITEESLIKPCSFMRINMMVMIGNKSLILIRRSFLSFGGKKVAESSMDTWCEKSNEWGFEYMIPSVVILVVELLWSGPFLFRKREIVTPLSYNDRISLHEALCWPILNFLTRQSFFVSTIFEVCVVVQYVV